MGETMVREDGTVTRSAEYVGSFPVDDCCLDDQIQQLHKHLKALKACNRRRSVSLKFSIKGVKIYDEDETTLLMAHALRRVSLSTARPSDAQFAFVSHNPRSPDTQLFCHLFKARHSRAAQFLNLLLIRCFQLSYLEKHPEEAQEESFGPLPRRAPSLLNQGFPLSVSALVSFRRAPNQGLLPGEKVFPTKNNKTPTKEQPNSQEEAFTASPSLVRSKAIRNKVLRSGAYRSFTYTPHKHRHLQDQLNSPQGKGQDKLKVRRARAPSLAETEEALAHAVWCWAGIAMESSSRLLEEDVLGSYLLCPHPKRPGCGSLRIRFSSRLVTYQIHNTSNGKCMLENCHEEFRTIDALIEHYTVVKGELNCRLSCARVNHCYEWEERLGVAPPSALKGPKRDTAKYSRRNQWV
ncbi:SH2 domain-containing protein 5 [Esox lucius]|uniref:SH2 domain containing 5 n=1 Tax=Esox lucius TaxID=8010 RepID=A0A3P8XXM4_ESOLU|nr:SH2 domain-containing protein 5 [Esox lucius]XP_010880064.1 SH2 domain-containing protein 5 [Esox lucius]XP_010880065.1 SH2 domain-containing protein 5 [Esox lucius]XP_010880066.1 SH2 domain-containing protein 5 [Esox lucius]XP_012993744.1 SH2 domain-containing protein 5 [Esox lucius]